MLVQPAFGQGTTVMITPAMVLQKEALIPLQFLEEWMFRKGNDVRWAEKEIDLTSWERRNPSQLSKELADENGRLECWLRLRIKLDTAFEKTPFYFFIHGWAATDVYVDGTLFNRYGNTGSNGKPFKEYNSTNRLPLPITLDKGKEHVIAVHFVDFVSGFPTYQLRSGWRLKYFVALMLPERLAVFVAVNSKIEVYQTVWLAVNIVLCLLFWLLAFQNPAERNLRIIGITSTLLTLQIAGNAIRSKIRLSYDIDSIISFLMLFITPFAIISALLLILRIFKRKPAMVFKILVLLIFIINISPLFFQNNLGPITLYLSSFISLYYIITSWKTLQGAQWAVVVGIFAGIGFGCFNFILASGSGSTTSFLLMTGLYLAFPLSLIVYVAIRFKEIIHDVQQNARQVVTLSEEKRQQAVNQQKILQDEVNKQTAELRNTLENLKSTQAQLIQSEKMASLGELTAGIAHEIQNPLNFVNNFSEVSNELIGEMKQELAIGNMQQANEIADDLKLNLEKINQHGKRADAIVKGMLEHSRTSSGQKEPTDINKLAEEYMRLAYHGLRAKDKSFNAEIKTDFDSSIGKISIVPQDIGRVILNLINNAFYAVGERQKADGLEFKPTVIVSTKRSLSLGEGRGEVLITVADNGNGIPQNIADKIFQPFFTTKPTGQGTGLGLSLAYDIVKSHGGEIKVETKEGEGTEFIIHLPTTPGTS